MFEVKYIKSIHMFPVIEEILDKKIRVRLSITGMSMYPFLREHRDSVVLLKVDSKDINWLDILLVRMVEGKYILHRYVKKRRTKIYICGDSQKICEGPLEPEQVLAKVVGVWREDTYISCSSIKWRILSFLWHMCYIFRTPILEGYRRYGRVLLLRFKRGFCYEKDI